MILMVSSSRFINDYQFQRPQKGLCSYLIQQIIGPNNLGGFGALEFTTLNWSS